MKRPTPSFRSARAFTLMELLVVVTIMGILFALLSTALPRVQEYSRRSACQNNLHQLGSAFLLYAGDHDGYGPLGDGSSMTTLSLGGNFKIFGALLPYLNYNYASGADLKVTPPMFICPSTTTSKRAYITKYNGIETSYWMNAQDIAKTTPVKLLSLPGRRAAMSDFCYWWNPASTSNNNHKGEGVNVWRIDGSIQWLPVSQTKGLTSWSWKALDDL